MNTFGVRQIIRLPFVQVTWIGSWDRPYYSRLGAWWHDKHRGFTLRFGAYLLLVGIR